MDFQSGQFKRWDKEGGVSGAVTYTGVGVAMAGVAVRGVGVVGGNEAAAGGKGGGGGVLGRRILRVVVLGG